ncbi:hypothetical protein [Streptomyces sp. NPDC057582]|uniref:hypothetical protein n=1 Tax=Streptomyces sp. NPDC057582 TaxID=3346174 RepID=UPI0036C8F550
MYAVSPYVSEYVVRNWFSGACGSLRAGRPASVPVRRATHGNFHDLGGPTYYAVIVHRDALRVAVGIVLGFVARRLVDSRIGFLAASREGSDSLFESSGLTEHRLKPLNDASSAELLALTHPDVSPAMRRRITSEARGNPLALVELPTALSAEQRATLAALPAVLPRSERLHALFAARVAHLPLRSWELLLAAALDGTVTCPRSRRLWPAGPPSTTSPPRNATSGDGLGRQPAAVLPASADRIRGGGAGDRLRTKTGPSGARRCAQGPAGAPHLAPGRGGHGPGRDGRGSAGGGRPPPPAAR